MKITFGDLLKCVTERGRRELVSRILKVELSRDKILGYVSDAVVYGINHGINAVPQDRRGSLHQALYTVHCATGRLLEVTDPSSDRGCEVSTGEAEVIRDEIGLLTRNVFTDSVVDALHGKIVKRVP